MDEELSNLVTSFRACVASEIVAHRQKKAASTPSRSSSAT